MQTLRIGLLQGLLGNPNMGCNALLYSAIRLLHEAAASMDLQLQVTCFSNVTSENLQLYPQLSGISIGSATPRMSLRQSVMDLITRFGTNRRKIREAFAACDVFFEIAGGDSFSDIYGLDRLEQANAMHRRIRRLKKPLVFLPQAIGPFTCPEAKAIASDSLSHARFIFTRDPLSYTEACQFAFPANVTQTVDMACFMDYEPLRTNRPGEVRIGLNPSGLLWHGGYTRDNQFGLLDDYPETLRAVLNMLAKMDLRPVLVAHVLSGPGFHIEDDYRVCRQLQSEFPFCTIAPYFYTPIEAKSFIAGLDLLIGSRMHACIAAYTSGVPVFPLAYSRKFSGLFQGALNWPHGADLTATPQDAILKTLGDCLDGLPDLRASMPPRLQTLAEFKEPMMTQFHSIMRDVLAPA